MFSFIPLFVRVFLVEFVRWGSHSVEFDSFRVSFFSQCVFPCTHWLDGLFALEFNKSSRTCKFPSSFFYLRFFSFAMPSSPSSFTFFPVSIVFPFGILFASSFAIRFNKIPNLNNFFRIFFSLTLLDSVVLHIFYVHRLLGGSFHGFGFTSQLMPAKKNVRISFDFIIALAYNVISRYRTFKHRNVRENETSIARVRVCVVMMMIFEFSGKR